MKCWQCNATLPDPEYGKVLFRAECDFCKAALHCCKNCKYYHPGKPNDCEVPGTPFIADRAKANICEDFKLCGKVQAQVTRSLHDVENQIFKNDGSAKSPDAKKTGPDKFNSLFKD